MGFTEAVKTCFRKYATFSGRARRSEYWYFYLFSILLGLVAGVLDAVLGGAVGTTETFRNTTGPFAGIVNLALLLPSIAVTVRRLHDTNHSGWLFGGFFLYIIVAVIAFVAGIGSMLTAGAKADASGTAIIVGGVMVLIGFAYGIYLFVLLVSNGTPGENRYGGDPKGPNVEVFN